ncbi:MAG: MerR family transcriptional regulator [Candidatus Latescibacterota bacterium]|nr:MAG: MerR family transcriptional regulator [Candidatus Latescibacterota bacterium]
MGVGLSKIYYSIGEVAELVGVRPSTLRYWEQEFPVLRPRKNRAGNRAYRERDLKAALVIRRLLYEEGYTIEKARDRLKDHNFLRELLDKPLEELLTPSDPVAFLKRELRNLLQWVKTW